LGARFAETFDALDYGADPSGTTDSAAVLRSLAGSNRAIRIPPGTYLLATTTAAPLSAYDSPCVLFSGCSNFSIDARGAVFIVGSGVALSSAFHFNACSNFTVIGGIIQGTRSGLSATQENVALTCSSVVDFHFSDMLFTGNFGGSGSGIAGDWLVNGVFENIYMPVAGNAVDVAYLKNVTFRNLYGFGADTNGASGTGSTGNKGFSIIVDIPNAANNNTGVSYTATDGVTIENCYFTNFNTGGFFSTGKNITIIGGEFSANPGNLTSKGIGVFLYYQNGGSFSSVGAPVQNLAILGTSINNNGSAVSGYGLFLDASTSSGIDVIQNISVVSCSFDNNTSAGVGCQSISNLNNIQVIADSFTGANQTTNIDSNTVSIATIIEPAQVVFQQGVTFNAATYMKNNLAMYWKDGSGSSQPILGVSSSNITFIRPASGSAYVSVQAYSGSDGLRVTNDASNPVYMLVSGSLKQVTVGATNSGGTGYRALIVPN